MGMLASLKRKKLNRRVSFLNLVTGKYYKEQATMRKQLKVMKNILYNLHQAIYTCYIEVVKIMQKV